MSFEYHPNVFLEKPQNIFMDRIICWEDTQELAKTFPAPLPSIKYKYDPNFIMEKKYDSTIIKIINIDTIECGLSLKKIKYNPLVLNLADEIISCIDIGSGSQEESLLRCTNLCLTLIPSGKLYPIREDEAIYSKNIQIIKMSEKNNWKLIEEPVFLDFIACPGIRMPKIDYTNKRKPKFKLDTDIEKLINKIKLILQVAYINKNDSLVLGGLGIGAFRCPSKHTAEIFKAVLKEYNGVFKRIDFAILKNVDDMYIVKNYDSIKKDNYEIFRDVFDD